MRYAFTALRAILPAFLCVLLGAMLFFSTPVAAQPAKADLIVIHKGKRVMELWHEGETIARFRVALGFSPVGHKEFEGDGKTPEGVYTISLKNENSQFYRSMKLNYPNEADKEYARMHRQKPGGLIMIHGLPNDKTAEEVGHPRVDWTNGCIAVTDEEMDDIWEKVEAGTAVLVMP
jgi:murein L,D-transpeptidase YafK